MKDINLKKEDEPLSEELFCEFIDTANEARKKQALLISRKPINELFLRKAIPCNDILEQAKEIGLYIPDKRQGGLRKNDFRNAKVIIDREGRLYNNFSLPQMKIIHALQCILSQQTQGLKRLIEDNTDSKKRHEKKIENIKNEIKQITDKETELIECDILPSVCPDIKGVNLCELSKEAQIIIADIKERNNSKGLVLATPATLFEALGRFHNEIGGENRNDLDKILDELENSTYLRFYPFGNIEAVKKKLLNVTTYYAKNGDVSKRLYIISLSSIFTEGAANDFLKIPENDSKIISKIDSLPFMFLYNWLLLELSENRRNTKGKKVNRITGKTKRGEYMKILQPLTNSNEIVLENNETEENKQGLFSIIYDPETVLHKSKAELINRLAKMLLILREEGFVRNWKFIGKNKMIEIEIYRLKNRQKDEI